MQVGVGGAYQAHVYRNLARAAEPHDAPFLQGREQLTLGGGGEVAHFVEEERTPVGQFQPSFLFFAGIGECPFLVSEQFALEQGFRHGTHVDGHERFCRARRMGEKITGHYVLPRAVLTQQKHVHVGLAQASDGGDDVPHAFRLADEQGLRRFPFGTEGFHAFLEPSHLRL